MMPSVEQLALPLEMNPGVVTATPARRARIADSAPEDDFAGVVTISRQPRSITKRKGRIKIQELNRTRNGHFICSGPCGSEITGIGILIKGLAYCLQCGKATQKVKDMTGWEVREELRELDKPRLAQERRNRDDFLGALAPKDMEGVEEVRNCLVK